ncbi:MAG: PQQ-like beta-propeller repeat protein [Armatimonadota bacterium]|nr:PQQ-like beta-propeller repeat protein [Armatimonadota bacterium]
MKARHCFFLIPFLSGSLWVAARAADWPQWRGPQRNGISSEVGWVWQWGKSGPKRLWTANVGEGHSSVVAVGSRIYTMGNVNNQDIVWCLNAGTGKMIWKYRYPCPAGNYAGSRATPTVEGKNVYILSRAGLALCLDAATGRKVWRRDLVRHTGATVPKWGFASSPLVEGNLVIYNVGDAGAALDKRTGVLQWHSGTGLASYASPVAYTIGQQRGVAIFPASGIVAVNPNDGRRLWQFSWAWNDPYQVNAADPIFAGENMFISSGYNRGCVLLRIGGGQPAVVYQNRNMRNHINTCVLLDGFLYGNDQSTLKCIEFKTGQERWQNGRIGKGGLIAAGKLIVLSERGELIIARATPDRYVELARAKVIPGTCYAPPTLAGGRIFCRNRAGDVVCLDVRSNRI